jgi:two-component system, NtrC family, nitrogen regulation response regulator NtrX
MPKSRILVIDDESAIRDSLKMTLEYEGYDVIGAATGQEGLALAEREAPDLVLLDVKMPGMDGIEVLERLRSMNDALPVVVVSGHGSISTAVEATKKGAFDFIEKPFASDRVLVSLRNALDHRQLRDENRSLKKAVEVRHQMVGDSTALRQVMAAVARAAPTNATVLIQGESGVGKELVARTIHRNSLRSRERFVQVNCAAIPEELIESELFGHEKGSFTGATEKQLGKFEQADRGTIFLDEVGDMSPKTQAKVLRVLQEGEVERLGSARTIKVDVRVIAATNKNLEEEIEKGRFREDLYFRLAVIPIHVPPLRERPEDVPLLVRHYIDYFSPETHYPGGARRAAASSLEGEHSRAQKHGRAADHHDGGGRDRRRRSARLAPLIFTAGRGKAGRRIRSSKGRHAAGVQRQRRARVSGGQAPGERLEHLEDRRGHRYAPKQSLQKTRAVPDQPGNGRLTRRVTTA